MIIVLTCRPRIRMRGAQPPLPFCVCGMEFKVQDIFAFRVPNTSEYNATFQEPETNFISKKRWVLFRKIENGKSAKA